MLIWKWKYYICLIKHINQFNSIKFVAKTTRKNNWATVFNGTTLNSTRRNLLRKQRFHLFKKLPSSGAAKNIRLLFQLFFFYLMRKFYNYTSWNWIFNKRKKEKKCNVKKRVWLGQSIRFYRARIVPRSHSVI